MIKGFRAIVRANKLGCLDVCEHGSAVVMSPADHWYLSVEIEHLKRIFDTSILNCESELELIANNSQLDNN